MSLLSLAHRITCALALFAIIARPSIAADSADINAARLYESSLKSVVAELKAVTSPSQQAVIDQIQIRVDPDDLSVLSVKASTNSGKKEIVFSLGFLNVLSYLNTAFVLSQVAFKDNNGYVHGGRYSDYIEYISKQVHDDGFTLGNSKKLPDFCQFIIGTAPNCYELYAAKWFVPYLNNVNRETFAFVLGHEIGHHVLGHLGSIVSANIVEKGVAHSALNLTSYDKLVEQQADYYSVEILTRSRIFLAQSVGVLYLFGNLINQKTGSVVNGYPHPMCRWALLLRHEDEIMVKDLNVIKYLKENGVDISDEIKSTSKIVNTLKECFPNKPRSKLH